MDEDTYLSLLAMVTPFLKKRDTIMRSAISPHERLTATLRCLATGRSYEDLKFLTIILPQALGRIILETCKAIYNVLRKDYLKLPQTKKEWKNIARDFEVKWNFPLCLGAMDGKHISVVAPDGSGSEYYNYKGRHSMVLMAIVDANYKFIMCDFGTNGRVFYGGVTKHNIFLKPNRLNILKPGRIRNSSLILPYVFVVDDAFPLREDMVKPFRQADLISQDRKICNYRISRARRIVKNGFGILSSRFRIFHTVINLQPENIEQIVMASCALHNFLIKSVTNSYFSSESFDKESTVVGTTTLGYTSDNTQMFRLQHNNPGNAPRLLKKVKEDLMNYFANEGQVPWQLNSI